MPAWWRQMDSDHIPLVLSLSKGEAAIANTSARVASLFRSHFDKLSTNGKG